METTTTISLATVSSPSREISREVKEFTKQFAALPVKKMDDLVLSESPALNMVDRDALAVCISTAIGDYLSFIGIPDAMTEETTYETACMMIDTHPHIPVDAIKTFFYECKRGAFGFHYNNMDGSRLLIWYDKFVMDYYKQLDDMEYAKHLNTKGDLANPLALQDENGEPINYDELLAAFRGKSLEDMLRERQIEEIRLEVYNANTHLYNEMPVEEADKRIEEAIIARLREANLITF